MKRWLILGALVLTAYGCRDTDVGVQIVSVVPPDDDCTFMDDSDVFVSLGQWDLAAGAPYISSPLVANGLVTRALDIQADMNNVRIERFEIELQAPDGTPLDTGDLPNPYSTVVNRVILSSDGEIATNGVVVGVAIPREYQTAILQAVGDAGEIVMSLQVAGNTAGGLSVKSVDFRWPVSICVGCLFNCTEGAFTDCLPGQDGRNWCPLNQRPNADGG